VPSRSSFAEQLTTDLAAVSHDAHLRVLPRAGGLQQAVSGDPDTAAPGVRESGWLDDKVAFARISMMPDTPAAQAWGDLFMREHADATALILDLRMCLGGTVAMMNGFLPYLYDAPTHLLTMDMRPGADQETEDWFDDTPELRRVETDGSVVRWEHWIEPNEAAKPDMPVYVLTDTTASACEHLTAALKATDRATVIGATTSGAGHFVAFHEFGDGYSVILPIGRTFDPITGSGWEGDGISPHIAVDPRDAEAEALLLIERLE
jgi:C-terminal processing protease CtpA/Prc